MAITAAPFALKNLGLDAEPLRQAISSLVPNNGGIVQTGDLTVTQTTVASLGVSVAVGRAWMPGTNTANLSGQQYSTQGQYFAINDAPFTVNLTTADPTNPRIDLIYIGAVDAAYGGASNVIKIDKITGTPAASPAAPTLPAGSNAIALAQVAVAANATSVTNANITQVAIGALKPFGHMGKTDGFTGGTNLTPVPGMAAQILRGGMTYDAVNYALVVPFAGLYRLTGRAYSSGGGTGGCLYEAMLNGGAGIGCSVWWTKSQVDEFTTLSPQIRRLSAGDKISMRALQPASVYGSDGYNGTYIEVEYIGPA